MSTRFEILAGATLLALSTFSATAASAQDRAADADAQRLLADTGGAAQVNINPATGTARFVRLPAAAPAAAARSRAAAAPSQSVHEKSRGFLANYGRLFGITNVDADLTLAKTDVDAQGGTHLTYGQNHRGVPVFGTSLKTHFDAEGQLRAVNGTTVPDIDLNVTPTAKRRGRGQDGPGPGVVPGRWCRRARHAARRLPRGAGQGREGTEPPGLARRGRQRHGRA